jgi:hypothetical protein
LNLNTVKLTKVDGNVPVAISASDISLSDDKTVITLAAPAARYAKNTEYKVVLSGVKTSAGKTVADYTTTFKTTNTSVVTAKFAANLGANNIRVNDVNSIVYDTFLSPSTITTSNITLTKVADGSRVAISVGLNPTNEIDVTLLEALTAGKKYQLSISNVKTATGFDAEALNYTFTANDTAPAIAGNVRTLTIANVNNSTVVWGKITSGTTLGGSYYAGLELSATYDSKLDATSVSSTTVTLTDKKADVAVPATVTYNTDSKIVKVVPTADLKENTTYVLKFSKDIKNEVGTKQGADSSIEFTTLDLTAPVVSSVASANGNSGLVIGDAQKLTVKFSEAVRNFRGATTNTLANKEIAIVKVGADLSALAADDVIAIDTISLVQGSTTDYEVTFKAADKDRNRTYQVIIFGKGSTVGSVVTDTESDATLFNELQANTTFTFTTEGADVAAPTIAKAVVGSSIDSTDNIQGATAVATSSAFIKFSEKINVTGVPATLKFTDGTNQVTETTLTQLVDDATAAKGDTTITVDGGHGIAAGDIVAFGSTYAVVKSVATNVLTLTQGLSADVADNAAIKVVNGITVSDAASDAKILKVNFATANAGNAVTSDKSYTLTILDTVTDVAGNKITKAEYSFVSGDKPAYNNSTATVTNFDVDVAVDGTYIVLPITDATSDLNNTTLTDANIKIVKKSDSSVAPYAIAYATYVKPGSETITNGLAANTDETTLTTITIAGSDKANVVVGSIITIAGVNDAFVVTAKTGDDITLNRAVGANVANTAVITRSQGVVLKLATDKKLDGNTEYQVKVSGVKDTAGNTIDAVTTTFRTVAVTAKLTAPTASIANEATGIAVNKEIKLTFNADIANVTDGATLLTVAAADGSANAKRVAFVNVATGAAIAGIVDVDGKSLIIKPAGFLVKDTVYKLVVDSSIASSAGTDLTEDYSLTFRTEQDASVKPLISSVEYFDLGTAGVNQNDIVKITLNTSADGLTAADVVAGALVFDGLGNESFDAAAAAITVSADKTTVTIKLGATAVFVPSLSKVKAANVNAGYTWLDGQGTAFSTDAVTIIKK